VWDLCQRAIGRGELRIKEIRLHGRGGQGAVKAAQTLVQTVVEEGGFAQFIPFFGVERKGSPVYGFLRIDDKAIRLKTQVYDPHCLIVMDDTLFDSVPVFEGLRERGIVVINTRRDPGQWADLTKGGRVGVVDATRIATETVGKNMPPNTAMLGAFAKTAAWVDWDALQARIEENFGRDNLEAARRAYAETVVRECRRGE
jgi:2-oxoacid:acceptor oxidoreductase gamma subunit (pyruvate/2-ketoisovalerate family)